MPKPYIERVGRILLKAWCKGDCPTLLLLRRGPAKNLRLEKSTEYADLLIEMRNPDGQLSKHHTSVCKACRERMLTDGPRPGELKALYAQDVYQWIESTVACGTASRHESERMAAMFAGRTPLRVLEELP